MCPQELNTCKRIGYEYFCEDLFVVKSKNRYSCASAIYFNLGSEIIKENCEFNFYFNKTDVKPALLDGGYHIILMNWPSYRRKICVHNNNIPLNIHSHPYILLNRSILCNCDIEAESNFLLKSLAAHEENEKPDLEVYFTVNLAFVDYLDQLKETTDKQVVRNWTNQEQILPIALKSLDINSSLMQAPKMLKEYVNQYREKSKLLDLQDKTSEEKQNEQNSKFRTFITSFITDTLVFSAALLTVIVTLVVIYMISGQSKLKMLIANIALQCIRVVEAFNPKYQDVHGDLGVLKFIMILILVVVMILAFGKLRKSRIFRGQLFSNIVKIKLFIADTQSYVPTELSKIARNVHLFKLTGTLLLENINSKRNWIWDVLEIDWRDVHVTLNGKEINLPISIIITLVDKLKVRWLFKKNPLHLYIMLKQRKSWFNLENTNQIKNIYLVTSRDSLIKLLLSLYFY